MGLWTFSERLWIHVLRFKCCFCVADYVVIRKNVWCVALNSVVRSLQGCGQLFPYFWYRFGGGVAEVSLKLVTASLVCLMVSLRACMTAYQTLPTPCLVNSLKSSSDISIMNMSILLEVEIPIVYSNIITRLC